MDAEYWSEEQESEATERGSNGDGKEVWCWIDDVANEVWTWYPGCRVPNVFMSAHQELGIGANVFTATAVITPDDEDSISSKAQDHGMKQKVGDLTIILPGSDEDPEYEVINLRRSDISLIQQHAERLLDTAKDLKDESIGENVAGNC